MSESGAKLRYAEHIRAIQEIAETFVEACGGTITLRALRMYMETQERNDAYISRALTGASAYGRLVFTRKKDGTPMVSLP